MTSRSLDRMLVEDAAEGGIYDLAARWTSDLIEIRLDRMGAFARSPSIGNKLRGALGEVMLASASEAVRSRRPCDRIATSTAEFLFGHRPSIVLGRCASEIAKPFVMSFRARRDGQLVICVRVFGLARARTPAIADALLIAVERRVLWDVLAKDGYSAAPQLVRVRDVSTSSEETATFERYSSESIDLVFDTPIDAERGNVANQPHHLFERIIRRLALLAPWQGASLRDEFTQLLNASAEVDIQPEDDDERDASLIGGHKFRNKLVLPPRLHLRNVSHQMRTALALGQQTHVGRGAALGLGRYHLVNVSNSADGMRELSDLLARNG